MTRTRSDRLTAVVRLAQLKEQRERVNFSAARESHAQQSKLCKQLERYLDEYRLLNTAGQTRVATLSALRNGSQFVAQLSASIEQQQQQEVLSEARMQEARKAWEIEMAKLDSLSSLLERSRNEENRELEHKADREAVDIWQAASTGAALRRARQG